MNTTKKQESQTSIGGHLLRFFISLIWVIVSVGIGMAGVLFMMGGTIASFFGSDSSVALYAMGIGLSLVFALVTFLVPYLRKKGSMTRWCGWLAFCDAAWWIYLLISESMGF